MFEVLNKTRVNSTFEKYRHDLYPMLQRKFNLNQSEPLDIESAKFIIDEILINHFEKRYTNYTFNETEWQMIE
jgi:hypothetical protein